MPLEQLHERQRVELARREAAMREEAAGSNPEATAWDIARYGEVG